MFPKKKRVDDPELRSRASQMPCTACGLHLRSGNDPDHVSSKGSGGDDTEDNLMPLCRTHHVERHAKGIGHMIDTYPNYLKWLQAHGRVDVLMKLAGRRIPFPSH